MTVVKPSWLYGPRDRASMPRMIRAIRAGKAKLIGDGSNRLNLTYAGNEAEGCILAATAEKALGQTYNLSNDGVITQAEYINGIAKCIGCKPVTKAVPYKVAYSAAFLMELFGHMFRPKEAASGDALRGVADRAAVLLLVRQGAERSGLEGDRALRPGDPAVGAVVPQERAGRVARPSGGLPQATHQAIASTDR